MKKYISPSIDVMALEPAKMCAGSDYEEIPIVEEEEETPSSMDLY